VRDFAWSADAEWLLMPSVAGVAGTGSSTYIPDYYDQNWNGNHKVVFVGGNWFDDTYAGLFYWVVQYESSLASYLVGSRLLYIPKDKHQSDQRL
jgi:hypothetical protein